MPGFLAASPHPAPVLLTLARLLDAIRDSLAPRSGEPALAHLCAWLVRLSTRIDRLFARWRAGTATPRRAPRPRAPRATAPARPRLSRARGWLLRHTRAAATAQYTLPLVLQDAEFARFLAEVPAAGRLLRPLYRLTGAPLPPHLALRRPVLPRRPDAACPRTPRPRTPPVPRPPREGSRAWYDALNTRPDGTRRTWPDCYGPRRWARPRPA